MKGIKYIVFSCVIALTSCMQLEDAYDKYMLPGGRIYPQKPLNAEACSGDGRVVLKWDRGSDLSVVKAIVSWNNGEGSKEFPINEDAEKVEVEIDNLSEKDYSFLVTTLDEQGNRSVPVELNSQAYGDVYKSSIYDRVASMTYVQHDKLIFDWNAGDISGGLQYTELYYRNAEGKECVLKVDAEDNEKTIIDDYSLDFPISAKSYYVPDTTCVDIFETEGVRITPLTILDRSNWTITADSYEPTGQTGYGGANPERVLDGLIEDTPNNGKVPTYWHTRHTGDNVPGYPHWLAVDMKKPINMKRVILQCRNDGNGGSYPFKDFTIQGSNDGDNWTDLETYDVYSLTDKSPQYYPVETKAYYTHFRIVMHHSVNGDPYAHLSELSIMGVEKSEE